MAARSIAFASALEELASLFHRIAVAQTVPGATGTMEDAGQVTALAARLAPEMVQLAYQICVQGRADLSLAPDEATGFSMTLLRLLAFEPAGPGATATAPGGSGAAIRNASPRRGAGSALPAAAEATVIRPTAPPARAVADPNAGSDATAAAVEPPAISAMPTDPAEWPAFVSGLRLAPMAAQLAAQTELKSFQGNVLTLALPATHKHLADRAYADRLKAALDQATGRKLMLAFEVGTAGEASLAARKMREQAEQKAKTEEAFRSEPFVQEALARFDAKIRPDSIKPAS